jgi:GNAT superfamily N-acetyltransferase
MNKTEQGMTQMEPELTRFVDESGKLTAWPAKKPMKDAAVSYIGTKFEFGRFYTEKEVNAVISDWHTFGDYFLLRRSLVENRIMLRKSDGSKYWKADIMQSSVQIAAYTLRDVTREDKPQIKEIQKSCASYALYSGKLFDDKDAEEMVADTPLPPGGFNEFCHVKLIEDKDGKALGYLQYYLGYPDGGTAFIGAFFIHAGLHRKGIGSDVMHGYSGFARARGITRLALGVMTENAPGYAFWAKQGFERSGVPRLDEETGKHAERLSKVF